MMNHLMKFGIEEKTWIEEMAKRENLKLLGSYEVVKVSDMSLIQKIPTDKGYLYFKSTGKASHFVAKLSHFLYSHYSDQTVKVIESHDTKPWLLLTELPGKPLRELKDEKKWKQCLQEYAEFQIKAAKHVNTFLEIGVPDRRMDQLKKEIQAHLSAMCLTGLTEEELKKVLSIESELISMCERMDGIVPYSLDHGDLHSGNIQYVENQPVFYDWGDASVTHPFFSTRIFWNSVYELIESESQWLEVVEEFRPYYLEPWTKFAPMSELEKLLTISDQLGCVYRALGWHLYINPFRLDQEDSKQRPAQWLQVLLKHRELVSKR